ncbi:MFS transporter [Neobittarella massiliensis]|uniref:MFS transporter n=2 Tax=Oscillospiraceae TaxID=216572 RepID=A0A8J6LU69_9FIRM|nr:MFS transporter [Neobittarella massiliensis]MBC3516334.1 MFS transporter [Neobittarella massiliensis]SCJ87338.1 putative transporter [uncultured Anaerotruncus sp.]
MQQRKKRSAVCIYLMVFMMGYALSTNLFGTAQPKIIQSYHLTLEQASYFSVLQSIGMLVSSAIVGLVVDRLDKSRVVGFMCLIMGLTLLAIGLMPPFLVLLALFLLLGVTSSVLDSSCASYMSDLYGDDRSKYISILHAFFGVGAMLGPLYVGFLNDRGLGWNWSYSLLSLVIMAAAIAYLFTLKVVGRPQPAVQNTAADGTRQKAPVGEMLRSFDLRILCAVNFLLAGFQMYTIWLPTYLNQANSQKYPLSFCALLLSLYSGGMIVSRLANSYISKYVHARDYITFVSVAAGLVLIAGLTLHNKLLWMAVSLLLGLLTGATHTAMFVLACSYFPQFPATATAFTGLCSAVGSICFHALTGAVAQRFSFTGAMFIPVCALLGTFLLLAITHHRRPNR